MKGIEIHHQNGQRFAVWQERLHDVFALHPDNPNPIMWFCEELLKDPKTEELYNDMIVGGVKTKRECLEAIDDAVD